MTRTQYGFLLVALGTGLALWRRFAPATRPVGERGEVIFSNTPRPSEP